MKYDLTLLLCALITLTTSIVSSQSFFDSYNKLIDSNEGTLESIQPKVENLLTKGEKEKATEEIIKIAHSFAIKFYFQGDLPKAITYTAKEVSYYKKNNLLNSKYSHALFNLGLFYRVNQQNTQALLNYQKVIELNNNPEKTGRSYCEIGIIHKKRGNYHEALIFLKKGISILEEYKIEKELLQPYYNISQVYGNIAITESNNKKTYENQLHFIQKAIALEERLHFPPRQKGPLYNTIARYYNTDANYDFKKAKKYFKKALIISESSKDSTRTTTLCRNIGNLFIREEIKIKLSQKDSIFYYLNKGLQFQTTYNSKDVSDIHLNFSSYSSSKKKYKKALLDNAIAFEKLVNLNIDSYISNFDTDTQNTTNDYSIINILSLRAGLLLKIYKTTKDESEVEQALQCLQIADSLIGNKQDATSQTQSKLFWRTHASSVYLRSVKACAILKKPRLASYFIEKNKAFLLNKNIIENQIKALLPEKIIERELQLKEDIVTLNQNKKQDDLFKATQLLEHFTDSIKTVYPEHFSVKNITHAFTLPEIQKHLDANSLVISYISDNDDSIKDSYLVLTSKKESHIYKIEDTENIGMLIKRFQSYLTRPFENNEDRNSFNEIAHTLYKKIIPEESKTILDHYSNLIVVPDGQLQNIPFEALITSKETPRYLIEDFRISYAYSMSFLMNNANLVRDNEKSFVGFAPVSFNNRDLKLLKKSKQELNSINTILDGEAYFDDDATTNNFLNYTQNTDIVHLATHADGTSNPWIAFKNDDLQASELYNYKSTAELVILSACNTTVGDIAPGEGVMSLARAFFFAGSNTVISSLWETNDKATSDIMVSFYKHLKSGHSKADALQEAKLDYIASSSLSQQSPYYWAPFILIGDSETTLYQNYTPQIIILILIAGIICFLLLLLNKKRKRG